MSFTLHPRLEADTFLIGDLCLCRALLMNDARFPWVILVPMREGIRNLLDLKEDDTATLMQETRFICRVMQGEFAPDQLNVAALGNVVSQLHMHVVARFHKDAAWPAPVWGFEKPQPYPQDESRTLIKELQDIIKNRNCSRPSL